MDAEKGPTPVHCDNCDYPLWNLGARECPECGTEFKPSEFEFKPNSMRFCCPHCDHPYYGTTEQGHIEPLEFACLKCGERVHMDEMVLRPGLGVREGETTLRTMPWLERKRIGRLKAFFKMIGIGATAPKALGRSIPAEASAWEAFAYAIRTALLFAAVSTIPMVLMQVLTTASMTAAMGGGGMGPVMIILQVLAWFVGAVVGLVVLSVLWVGLAHAILMMSGTTNGIRRTAHAIFYTAGANVLSAIPCCGYSFGWIWWSISATIALCETQPTGGLRATVAVFTGPALLCVTAVGLWIFAIMAPIAAMGGMAGAGPGGIGGTTWNVNSALMTAASAKGKTPEHVGELLVSGELQQWSGMTVGGTATAVLLHPSTNTTAADVTLGGTPVEDVMAGTRMESLTAVAEAIDAMPADVVAHRLGDYVFTYHGRQLNTWSGNTQGLWTVLMLPDPGANPNLPASATIEMATADYSITTATLGELPGLIEEQNALRATAGLGALPADLHLIGQGAAVGAAGTPDDG